MAIELTIEITIEMVPFEPDGSKCDVCGDTIFLEGRKAIFIVGGGKMFGKKVGELDHRFCRSCGDVVESEFELEGGNDVEKDY